MKETYSKNYFEKYAALTLTKVLDVSADNIIQADRPDLRIPKRNFGIEVTQALTPAEAVADICSWAKRTKEQKLWDLFR